MIKYILLSFIFLFLVSCKEVSLTDEKTITQGNDTVGEVDIVLSKVDALNSLAEIDDNQSHPLLFKASGTEPGWFAEFFDNKLRLVVDYGKDSLLLDDSFNNINDEKGFTYVKSLKMNNKQQSVTISIQNKPCTDIAGNKADRLVIIKYNNVLYNGCGSFIK